MCNFIFKKAAASALRSAAALPKRKRWRSFIGSKFFGRDAAYSLVSQRPQKAVFPAVPLNALFPQTFSMAARIFSLAGL